MPKGINPIRKAKLKQELLKSNQSIKSAVIKAGYSENSAINAHRLTVVKRCLEEIEAQFKLSELTPEMVIQQLQATRQLALEKRDYATAAFCSTQLGKYLAMFTDRNESNVSVKVCPEEKDELIKLRGSLFIDTPMGSIGKG